MLQVEAIRSRYVGRVSQPRLAPPEPARGQLREYEAEAAELGIKLYPWQRIAARYITATVERGRGRPAKNTSPRWKYTEVCIVAARQNGKTDLLLPRIRMGLKRGESILHTAQNRRLPRKTFLRLAGMIAADPELDWDIRKANGQEEITTPQGGRYSLVAPNMSSRGESADLVLIDEVREQHDQELMDAMLPTITARPNAQIIYLSNAGDEQSIVLNDLRRRGTEDPDPRLAYLEWSAAPERDIDDRNGWAEANPALGHGNLTLANLDYFRANRPPTSFETEHLCRWVITSMPRIVSEFAWAQAQATTEAPRRPALGINVDADGSRASAVIAWQQSDGTIGLRVIADVTGDPIDVTDFGPELRTLAVRLGVKETGFDPWTDKDLARYLRTSQVVNGTDFANACAKFHEIVETGGMRWQDADVITSDLAWTGRRPVGKRAWMAVPAKEDRPVTAVLAAIRAVWLASGPRPAAPKVM